MLNLGVSLFYPVTMKNFKKLTLEIFIFFSRAHIGPREKMSKVEYFRKGIKFFTNSICINLKIKASSFRLHFVNYTQLWKILRYFVLNFYYMRDMWRHGTEMAETDHVMRPYYSLCTLSPNVHTVERNSVLKGVSAVRYQPKVQLFICKNLLFNYPLWMILCRTFIIKHALRPHVVPFVSVKKMKRIKINTNDIIFYL